MNVWLVGHAGCYNRGCEAIVHSTESLLAERFGKCRYTMWSYDHAADARALRNRPYQVRDAGKPCRPLDRCRAIRKLGRLPGGKLGQRILRSLPGWPACALSIGGDNFTLDYGSPKRFVATGRLLMDAGIPFVIWGASIGPFDAEPRVENVMREFLQRVDLITVRESGTAEYLRSLGVTDNVVKTADPAFALRTKEYGGPEARFVQSGDVVGLNVSALIARWFPDHDLDAMLAEFAGLVRAMIAQGFKVLLVPHVTAGDGPLHHNDDQVLGMLRSRIDRRDDQVALLPGNLEAGQVKWMISQCRFFVGARTHATIAAFSTGVPTIAIGYSRKARGICRDLFENEDYLLPTPELRTAALLNKWQRLQRDESSIRNVLTRKRPELLAAARRNADALAELLNNGGAK